MESQNENLSNQVKRLQSIITGGNGGGIGRPHHQASTVLMVFILSTAFLFTNLRSHQDKSSTAVEDELDSINSKMPSTGT